METQVTEIKQGTGISVINTFDTMQRMAKLFANSSIVPEAFRGNTPTAVANCFIAVDMAMRLNADPFMVMQNLYIVKGKPAFSSSFLIATVNSCGRFEPLKFSKIEARNQIMYNGKEIPNLSCFAYTREKGSEDVLTGAIIDLQMAISEGWVQKSGSKWQTMPEQMLRYRAAAFWVRTYCPEVAMGLYSDDEVKDFTDYQDVEVKETSNPQKEGKKIILSKPNKEPNPVTEQEPSSMDGEQTAPAVAELTTQEPQEKQKKQAGRPIKVPIIWM